jgi:hypothetical protein
MNKNIKSLQTDMHQMQTDIHQMQNGKSSSSFSPSTISTTGGKERKRVKTSTNRALGRVIIPAALKTTIEAHKTEWLWTGGLFALPLKAKAELLKEAKGKLDVYVKAKFTVYFFLSSSLTFFLHSTKNGGPSF